MFGYSLWCSCCCFPYLMWFGLLMYVNCKFAVSFFWQRKVQSFSPFSFFYLVGILFWRVLVDGFSIFSFWRKKDSVKLLGFIGWCSQAAVSRFDKRWWTSNMTCEAFYIYVNPMLKSSSCYKVNAIVCLSSFNIIISPFAILIWHQSSKLIIVFVVLPECSYRLCLL